MSDPDSRPDDQDVASDSEPPIGLSLAVVREGGNWDPFEPVDAAILAAGTAVARTSELEVGTAEASVALSSDAHVRALNATYRGKDKPTNVLSFPAVASLPSDAGAPRYLGDIILAAETVEHEAVELGIPPLHHLQHLVVHGILHLLGYDHEGDAEADEMEALEIRILAHMGIPNPYADALPGTEVSP